MYLSVIPHKLGRNVNPYEVHQKLWGAFPGHDRKDPRPFLFAICEEEGHIYVRSSKKPSWQSADIEVLREPTAYLEGAVLSIEVLIDGARARRWKKLSFEGSERSLDSHEIRTFAVEKLTKAGLRPLTDEDDNGALVPQMWLQPLSGKPARRPRGGRAIPVRLWRCRAMVEVVDAQIFQEALEKGVGRKRAFGAGMIMVRGM